MTTERSALATARRAARFLSDAAQAPAAEGRPRTVDAWFKVVWALALGGAAKQASRLLDDLCRGRDEGSGAFRHRQDRRFLYPNVWLLIGAHVLGRFDVSLPLLGFLRRHQAANGGFASNRPGQGPPEQDMLSTAMAGLACLYGNDLDAAAGAAGWLRRTLDAQPDAARCLAMSTGADGRPIVAVAPDRRYRYLIDWSAPRQAFYAPGAAIAFLTKLALATGDRRQLELAEQYFALAARAPTGLAGGIEDYPTGGKLGWGAAWLYRATGREECRASAERIVAYLSASQLPDGRWPPFHDSSDANLAAEFSILLTEIAAALD